MDPLQVSAQFAAYVWFTEKQGGTPEARLVARRLARDHWKTFLPVAHEGWGRLLVKIATRRDRAEQARRRGRIEKKRNPNRTLAAVS